MSKNLIQKKVRAGARKRKMNKRKESNKLARMRNLKEKESRRTRNQWSKAGSKLP